MPGIAFNEGPTTLMQPRLVIALLVAACLLQGCFAPANPDEAREHGLVEIEDFASDAARLRMFEYVPASVRPKAPLVVVLHHCFQNALDYFVDAGWRDVADYYGLVLLLPEERDSALLCFDFAAGQARGRGEPEAIRQMMERMFRTHEIDRARVYATGLSAGGSMAVIMMALHPELFAAGGVIGSVPFGCPAGLGMTACVGSTNADAETLRRRVLDVAPPSGPWPRLSVWVGGGDWVVHPSNSPAIVRQWTALHGIAGQTPERMAAGPLVRETYRDAGGRAVVELNTIASIGHSVPVDLARGCGHVRAAQMFDLVSDIGICSTLEMVRFWGLGAASLTH